MQLANSELSKYLWLLVPKGESYFIHYSLGVCVDHCVYASVCVCVGTCVCVRVCMCVYAYLHKYAMTKQYMKQMLQRLRCRIELTEVSSSNPTCSAFCCFCVCMRMCRVDLVWTTGGPVVDHPWIPDRPPMVVLVLIKPSVLLAPVSAR